MSIMHAPAACSSFLCFFCFGVCAACHGYAFYVSRYDKICDGCDFDKREEEFDYYETQLTLLFTVASILGVSSIFYALYRCVESYCMLILRLIANVCAMIIFLGFSCDALSEDGINTSKVRDLTFSTAGDWGSTVAFAAAWVAISAFEINELTFASRRIHVRVFVKIQVFLFWALLAVSFCVSGYDLLDDADIEATDSESVYSKIILAMAGMCALAGILFAIFCFVEVAEFAKLHMITGALASILYVSSIVYQSYHFREHMDDLEDELAVGRNSDKMEKIFDHFMKIHNCRVAGDVFLALAWFSTIGFDLYFLHHIHDSRAADSRAAGNVKSNNPTAQIQLTF